MSRVSDKLAFLVASSGAKKYVARKRVRSSNAILPLTAEADKRVLSRNDFLYAWDAPALRLTEALVDIYNKEFPTDVRPSGYCGGSAVPGDWNVLRNVSGYGMNPKPIPFLDNQHFYENAGLAKTIAPADAAYLRELMRLFFGHTSPAGIHIRKEASTSFPYFTTDNDYKKLSLMKILHNVDDFLNAASATNGDGLKYALNEYHSLFYYAIHKREQANAILFKDGKWSSKPRTAPSEHAAREGKFDEVTYADMTVRGSDGEVIADHFAMRVRDVFGLNGPLNYFLTAIFAQFRAVYLERFAFTYKVRGDQDKADRLRPFKFVVGSDVKTMDKLIPRVFTDLFFEYMRDYLDDRVVTVMERAYRAPFCAPHPWYDTPAEYSPFFGGSPLEPEDLVHNPGLPSGIAFNPDFGKLWMTWNYVLVMRDAGVITSPAGIEAFLQGKNPQACLLDTADDAAFGASTKALADFLKTAKSPYAVLEPEVPVIYLGGVFTETSAGIDVFPNPITYVANLLCREDSIDRPRNGRLGNVAWAEGYVARNLVYSRTPIFRDMKAILEEQVRKHTGVNPSVVARMLSFGDPLSSVDAQVIANPAVLHYKVDPSQVSQAVLDSVVSTIPSEDVSPHITHLFKRK